MTTLAFNCLHSCILNLIKNTSQWKVSYNVVSNTTVVVVYVMVINVLFDNLYSSKKDALQIMAKNKQQNPII